MTSTIERRDCSTFETSRLGSGLDLDFKNIRKLKYALQDCVKYIQINLYVT